MRERARLIPYILIATALLAAFVASPTARATPLRRAAGQTVPTRTPTRPYAPTDVVTPQPPAPTDAPAPATPTSAPGLPAPATAAPLPPASATAGAPALAVSIEPGNVATWPGAAHTFTVTVSNRGSVNARQLLLELALPAGLAPGEVRGGAATWRGRTLRLPAASLAPGARLTTVFAVSVEQDAAGVALVLRAVATAAGGGRASAVSVLALPPTELPPTGGRARPAARR